MSLIKKSLSNTKFALSYYRKTIIIAVMVLIIGSCVLAFCAGGGNSRNGGIDNKATYPDAGALTISVMDQLDKICNIEGLNSTVNKVSITFDPDSDVLCIGGRTIENVGVLTAVTEIFEGIAFCIVTLTFFMSFMSVREAEITAEELVKKIALFAACIVLLFFAQDICLGIANIGTGITEKVADSAMGTQADMDEQAAVVASIKQAVYEECTVDNAGHWYSGFTEGITAIGLYLQLLIPYLAMWAVSLITAVTCWSRALEILILSTFSPLAFADASDIDHQFGRGGGARFLKNVMALSISGAIIVFIMAITTNITVDILADGIVGGASVSGFLASTGDLLLIGFAQAGLVLKAQSMGKTICGVG